MHSKVCAGVVILLSLLVVSEAQNSQWQGMATEFLQYFKCKRINSKMNRLALEIRVHKSACRRFNSFQLCYFFQQMKMEFCDQDKLIQIMPGLVKYKYKCMAGNSLQMAPAGGRGGRFSTKPKNLL